jgi:hypothetical protein
MKITVMDTVPNEISSSIHYGKIKHSLHSHIVTFCRDKKDLKNDLKLLSYGVGREYDYDILIEVMEGLKEKYNGLDNNIGLEYHIEFTRYDFALIVTAIIKRADIEVKKFVFRYKKKSTGDSMINTKLDIDRNSSAARITPSNRNNDETDTFNENSVNSDYKIIKRRARRKVSK